MADRRIDVLGIWERIWQWLFFITIVLVLLPSRAAAKRRVLGDRIPAAAERSEVYRDDFSDGALLAYVWLILT